MTNAHQNYSFTKADPDAYRIDRATERLDVTAEPRVAGMHVIHVGDARPFEAEAARDSYGRMRLIRPASKGEGRGRFS